MCPGMSVISEAEGIEGDSGWAYLDDGGDDNFDASIVEDERRVYQRHDPNTSLSAM